MMDRKIGKNASLVEVSRPGEIVGMVLLMIDKYDRVVVFIGYFSRKVFAKRITNKESSKIVDFI